MNNHVASLSLSITALLASSLLQTSVARASSVKPADVSKICASEVISNPATEKLDTAEPLPKKTDGAEAGLKPVAGKADGAELELSKASSPSNPKLMQKPGNGNKQPCS